MPSAASVFCLVPTRGRTDRIISDLKAADFPPVRIGVLFLEHPGENDRDLLPDSRKLTGAAALSAAPIRGALTWVGGIDRLVVPGAGSFIAAGPVIGALRQPRNGGSGGPIARGLMRLGIGIADATRYERAIRWDAHILVSVHGVNSHAGARAHAIFTASSALAIITAPDLAPPPDHPPGSPAALPLPSE